MKRGLVLRRVAEREFDESIAHYESEREGLGLEFRAAIEKYFQRIVDNPEWFPKVRSEVRRAVVIRRFPFVIHFLVERAHRDPVRLPHEPRTGATEIPAIKLPPA